MSSIRRDRDLGRSVSRFRKSPDFVKARAMQLYAEVGPVEASRRMGIDRTTLNRWRKELGIPSRRLQPVTVEDVEQTILEQERIRLDLRGLLLQKSRLMLGLIDAGMKAEDMKHISTAVGTLVDKYRLELGEVTARTERHNPAEGKEDHETRALMAAIDAELGRRTTGTAPGAPESAPSKPEVRGET